MSEKEIEEDDRKKAEAAAANAALEAPESESEESEGDIEEKPTRVVQPKYKVVHSYPVDLGDSWEGYQTPQMEHEKTVRSKVPTHLTITIDLKWADSMKGADLDINE